MKLKTRSLSHPCHGGVDAPQWLMYVAPPAPPHLLSAHTPATPPPQQRVLQGYNVADSLLSLACSSLRAAAERFAPTQLHLFHTNADSTNAPRAPELVDDFGDGVVEAEDLPFAPAAAATTIALRSNDKEEDGLAARYYPSVARASLSGYAHAVDAHPALRVCASSQHPGSP